MSRPTIICLTPIKNESWVLDRFLKCVSLWADHIIIADQMSDDKSREIARSYSKVTLLDNTSPIFDEPFSQNLLLDAARRIPGPRLLVALDADEVLSATYMNSLEWETLMKSPIGTVGLFKIINLAPDLHHCWLAGSGNYFPLAFMDDGSEHVASKIHGLRIPVPPRSPRILLQDIRVLHYQFTDWERMRSKHRWYQCWERLNQPSKSAIGIYREYHHMDAITINERMSINHAWLAGYEQQSIDMTSTNSESSYRWDREILALFAEHGVQKFKRESIWDKSWPSLSRNLQFNESPNSFLDPRSFPDKLVHAWLRRTQSHASTLLVRFIDQLLSYIGW